MRRRLLPPFAEGHAGFLLEAPLDGTFSSINRPADDLQESACQRDRKRAVPRFSERCNGFAEFRLTTFRRLGNRTGKFTSTGSSTGWVVPKQPAKIFAEGKEVRVPVLARSNRTESTPDRNAVEGKLVSELVGRIA